VSTLPNSMCIGIKCPKLDNLRKLIIDFIKADLHVDTFSMGIQNIILYNVKFKYYPYVYAYTQHMQRKSCKDYLRIIFNKHTLYKLTIN
jgi:hypothetical protein